jgi:16S rRNA pseudouridine516 synthase
MSARCNRLDRQISFLLGISRDDVRLLLAQKRIKVDGLIAESRELLVDGFSCITLDEEILQTGTSIYLMLHKPRGVLSATADKQHSTVLDLIDHPLCSMLHIAGRLDLHASGLMLLTNDGRWSRHLSAPASGVEKVYLVTVQNPLEAEYVAAFHAGMFFPFENITTRPARLEILDRHTARVTLQEGRYHQIKRMFGRFRNPVLAIHRIAIGGLALDAALAPGASRELRMDEVQSACPGFAVRTLAAAI